MASSDIELFDFYTRYLWGSSDFSTWQQGMVDHSRGMFEGLLAGSVLSGFGLSIGGGLSINVAPGIASGPTGYLHVMAASANVQCTAPTGSNPRRDLLVQRPVLVPNTFITVPTDPFAAPVPLKIQQSCGLFIIQGTPAASPLYPSTQPGDVVLTGLRTAPGATGYAVTDFDLEKRDIPGKNANFQQNFGKYDDRLRCYRSTLPLLGVKPSQLSSAAGLPTAFSYVNKVTPSIFPKTSGGLYNGAAGDTFLNFLTGAITGADQASSSFAPLIPSAGNCVVATIGLLASDQINVSYGNVGTRAQCFAGIQNQATAGAGSVNFPNTIKALAFVVLSSGDGVNITEMDFVDARGIAGFAASAASGVRTVTGADTATIFDSLLRDDCTGGSFTQKLPPLASSLGQEITILKIDGTTNFPTVAGNASGELIAYEGLTLNTYDRLINPGDSRKFKNSIGTIWDVL